MPLSLCKSAAGRLMAFLTHQAPPPNAPEPREATLDGLPHTGQYRRRDVLPHQSITHNTMADFRNMNFKEQDEPAAHRSFVRQLREGRARFTMMPHSRTGYELMHVRLDDEATTLTWAPAACASVDQVEKMALSSVVSIVPWTHKHPSKKPSRAELAMGANGVYHGISVAYSSHKPIQVMLLCHNKTDQGQLEASFRSLAHAARERGGVGVTSTGPRKVLIRTLPSPIKSSRTMSVSTGPRPRRRLRDIRLSLSSMAGSSMGYFKGKYGAA